VPVTHKLLSFLGTDYTDFTVLSIVIATK